MINPAGHRFVMLRSATAGLRSLASDEERKHVIFSMLRGETPGLVCEVCGLSADDVCRCGAMSFLGASCTPRPRTVDAFAEHGTDGESLYLDTGYMDLEEQEVSLFRAALSDTLRQSAHAAGGIPTLSKKEER